jgi:hypothetical protein
VFFIPSHSQKHKEKYRSKVVASNKLEKGPLKVLENKILLICCCYCSSQSLINLQCWTHQSGSHRNWTGLVHRSSVPALWVQLGIETNGKCCGAQYYILDIDLVYQVLSCFYSCWAFCSTQSEVGLVCIGWLLTELPLTCLSWVGDGWGSCSCYSPSQFVWCMTCVCFLKPSLYCLRLEDPFVGKVSYWI